MKRSKIEEAFEAIETWRFRAILEVVAHRYGYSVDLKKVPDIHDICNVAWMLKMEVHNLLLIVVYTVDEVIEDAEALEDLALKVGDMPNEEQESLVYGLLSEAVKRAIAKCEPVGSMFSPELAMAAHEAIH